ncbi:MAG: XRE family transcriptional regulator [Eubacterium sp.]|nr:XRE family transcriptional regulator [Eubacterium sp.]
MSIGSNIKKRRFELNLSQQELADAMGYKTRSTIAKIESGKNDVSHSKLVKFAEVLDTTVDYLISGHSLAERVESFERTEHVVRSEHGYSASKTVAVILAGGKSSRNLQNMPNQFVNLLGKPTIVYCLEAYQHHPSIDEIYIVCLKGWESIVSAYAEEFGITKLRGIIPGAASGILSIRNAVSYLEDICGQNDVVVFQESTRPMVDGNMISILLQACAESGNANISQSMRDYLQFISEDSGVHPVDRNRMLEIQSPEAHLYGDLIQIFEQARREKHDLTESCIAMLMYNLHYSINFVEGNARNLKIIRQEDAEIVESLLRHRLANR